MGPTGHEVNERTGRERASLGPCLVGNQTSRVPGFEGEVRGLWGREAAGSVWTGF